MEIGTKAQNSQTARIIYATPATLTGDLIQGGEGGFKIPMLRVASTHAAASASDEGASGLLSSLGILSVSALEVEA